MATNLDIDPKLIDEAKRLGKHRTKKEAVTQALREYVHRHELKGILDLAGTVEFDPAWDYKSQRRRA